MGWAGPKSRRDVHDDAMLAVSPAGIESAGRVALPMASAWHHEA